MSRLSETIITGDMVTYRKSNDGYFYNSDVPQITFNIDEITTLPDGSTSITPGVDSVIASMGTPEETFNLLNPLNDSIIGTAKFQDVFVILYSLFFHSVLNKK